MAGTSVERVVMAWDGAGKQVPTPESQVVQIQNSGLAINADGGTLFTPRYARAFFCPDIDHLPVKLLKIEPPGTLRTKTVLKEQADGTRYYVDELRPINHWRVELEFPAPCVRRMSGPTNVGSVAVLTEKDARDPYFSDLPQSDRDLIVAAVVS